jgi:hypothetical protein
VNATVRRRVHRDVDRLDYRRPADHLPEQAPLPPTPCQVPPPERADRCPLPLALRPPEATLTLTAPLLLTLPLTGMPPDPEMMPSWISTPIPEFGSQAPRWVMICTFQLPSNGVTAWAALLWAANAIPAAMTAERVGSEIIFMTTILEVGSRSRLRTIESETARRQYT